MLKKAKHFMLKLLKPNSGVSSRRFISIAGFIFVCFISLVDLFTNLTVSDYVYEGLIFVILGGLGSTAVGAYSNKNKTTESFPIEYNETPPNVEPPAQ